MHPDGPELPEALSLSIHGGMGAPWYRVEWTGAGLRYTLVDDRTGARDEVDLAPDSGEWRRFWRAVERAGVWEWAAEHDDFAAVDAPTWSVEITHGDRQIRTWGQNSYPREPSGPDDPAPDPGPASEREPSRPFRTLCSAVRRLVGGRAFS
jgi:hypothetical protein